VKSKLRKQLGCSPRYFVKTDKIYKVALRRC